MKPLPTPRYRQEDGRTCVDIRLRTAQQLFDGRDPAPFRERDIDEDAVEYILDAFQELHPKSPVKLVFWVEEELSASLPAAAVVEAVQAHFAWEVERGQRRIREHVRQGQLALGLGLAVLTLFLTLAGLTSWLPEGPWQPILREGFVIIAWVALWRPLDLLLFDWWPLARRRRLCARVVAAEVSVRHAAAPPGVTLHRG